MDNSTVFLILGGAALVLCLAFVYFYVTSKRMLDEMWAVDTYSANELRRMCSGNFSATVEVEGAVSCDEPLTSLAAQVPCCWYHTKVEYEEERTRLVTDTDSHGHTSTHTETDRSWNSGLDVTRSTIFKVEDKTGFVLVEPTGSDIDTITITNEVVYSRQPWFESVPYSDTGKYKVFEEAFMPTGYAYVLGEAMSVDDKHGADVLIHYPAKGYLDTNKRFFIISRKTEKELTRSKQITTSVCFWFAIVTFLGGIFCLMVGLGIGPIVVR